MRAQLSRPPSTRDAPPVSLSGQLPPTPGSGPQRSRRSFVSHGPGGGADGLRFHCPTPSCGASECRPRMGDQEIRTRRQRRSGHSSNGVVEAANGESAETRPGLFGREIEAPLGSLIADVDRLGGWCERVRTGSGPECHVRAAGYRLNAKGASLGPCDQGGVGPCNRALVSLRTQCASRAVDSETCPLRACAARPDARGEQTDGVRPRQSPLPVLRFHSREH